MQHVVLLAGCALVGCRTFAVQAHWVTQLAGEGVGMGRALSVLVASGEH